jgi:hypothetical protein
MAGRPQTHRGFKEADEVGRIAEQAVADFLRQLPTTQSIRDVRDAPEWRARGVDLVVTDESGGERWVEVNGDTKGGQYRNFFLETISNEELQTPGCFVATQSHQFAYCYIDTGDLYILETKPAQAWFASHRHKMEDGRAYTLRADRSVSHYTLGKKAPIKLVLRNVEHLGPLDVRQFILPYNEGRAFRKSVADAGWHDE